MKPPSEANGTVNSITSGCRKLSKRDAISRNDMTTASRKFH